MYTDGSGKGKVQNRIALEQFLKERPNRNFIHTITEIGSPSAAQRGYYFVEIVPKIMEAFRDMGEVLTKQQVHERVKMFCPTMFLEKEVMGKFQRVAFRSFTDEDFTTQDMARYIDEAIRFAAETCHIEISEPNII